MDVRYFRAAFFSDVPDRAAFYFSSDASEYYFRQDASSAVSSSRDRSVVAVDALRVVYLPSAPVRSSSLS